MIREPAIEVVPDTPYPAISLGVAEANTLIRRMKATTEKHVFYRMRPGCLRKVLAALVMVIDKTAGSIEFGCISWDECETDMLVP